MKDNLVQVDTDQKFDVCFILSKIPTKQQFEIIDAICENHTDLCVNGEFYTDAAGNLLVADSNGIEIGYIDMDKQEFVQTKITTTTSQF